MDLFSASKIGANGERRKTTMMPMRVHEMDLGLPKSAGKLDKTKRSQPIRVGPLLEAMERNNSKTKSFAQCANVAPVGRGTVRRQLYNEAADETLPDTCIIGGSHYNTKNSEKDLIDIGSTGKSRAVRLGLSKSDGKVKMNGHRSQPIRVKLLMESWEKSQTAKRAAKKSIMGNLRSVNVRRKLYSTVPSPEASQKVAKKSLASSKLQKSVVASQKNEKIVKTNTTEKGGNRKSFLLPPNSIRDKHVSRKAKETIVEESPTSLFSEEQNTTNPPKITDQINVATAADTHEKIAILPEAETQPYALRSVESVVAGSSQQSQRIFEAHNEIPRPTVIIGLATSTVSKARNQSVSSECSSKSGFALSQPPLQELNKNSTMPRHRIDAADTSLQDLLGNSQRNRQVSPRNGTFPYNSFLRNCENSERSLAQMDLQTLSWLHGNMKLSIQTMEESLFSMKTMIKAIEDVMSSSEPEEKPRKTDKNDNVPAGIPEILVDGKANDEDLKENDLSAVSFAREDEIFEGNDDFAEENKENCDDDFAEENKENCDDDFAEENKENCDDDVAEKNKENCDDDFAEENKENFSATNGPEENEEQQEKGEKTRRRSVRLAAIEARSIKNMDDSFSRIEKDLNITHDKSKPATPDASTPAKRKTVDPRSRRSIREYMALKSCAKFLQTPDHKGLPTPKCEKTGTPAQRRATERALSLRVLNQLHNLYDESPE